MTGGSSRADECLTWLEQAWQLIAIVLVAVVVGFATITVTGWIKTWNLPFCDSNSKFPVNCIPCPEHGICQGGKVECLTGFRRYGRKCVEDTHIEKSARKLAHLIRDHVCGVNGEAACNGEGIVWLTENEVLTAVKHRDPTLAGANSWLAQEKAVASASRMLDTKTVGMTVFSCPSHLIDSYKPFDCRLREWIFGNFLKLLVLIPVVLFISTFVFKRWHRRKLHLRAEQLYSQVCEALEEKATDGENEPWIVASRLRDHLLRPGERKNRALWLEVERFVQEDSRIELYPMIVKGDSRIVWEWQVEGALSPANLRKKRAAEDVQSPPSYSPAKPLKLEKNL